MTCIYFTPDSRKESPRGAPYLLLPKLSAIFSWKARSGVATQLDGHLQMTGYKARFTASIKEFSKYLVIFFASGFNFFFINT